jgi:hypothetical protein
MGEGGAFCLNLHFSLHRYLVVLSYMACEGD